MTDAAPAFILLQSQDFFDWESEYNAAMSIYEIKLEKLTYGGEAMGRLPDSLTGTGGRAVFVPFGLPEEIVRVELVGERKNFARGKIVEVVKAAPNRIPPKCRHFGACGGCHYQHLSYSDQLKAKAEILRDQLQRIGRIENPPVDAMVASRLAWNYRNHVQFHLTKDGRLGFINAQGSETLAVEECHLPEENIAAFWKDLQFESGEDVSRVSIRAGDGLMVVLESDSPDAPEMEVETDVSVAHIFEGDAVTLAGRGYVVMQVLGKDFKVSAPSFFQVNTPMAEKMVEHLLACMPAANSQLLDVYCGVGLFSKFFAPRVQRLIGVESSPSACEDFTVNLDEFDNVELYEGAAEEILPALAKQTTGGWIAIIDPPRAGVERHALDALAAIRPQTIAYVSCDPSTLARDAARLIADGYALKRVTPFDLFPQTYHIEAIAIFESK